MVSKLNHAVWLSLRGSIDKGNKELRRREELETLEEEQIRAYLDLQVWPYNTCHTSHQRVT